MLALRRVFSPPTVMRGFRAMSSSKLGDPVPEDQGTIPVDHQHAVGVARKEEVFNKVFGEEFYDRDAVAAHDEGSKENPIKVYSADPSRFVGISIPEDCTIRWMELKAGEIAFDPVTLNHFALYHVPDAAVDEAVAKADAEY